MPIYVVIPLLVVALLAGFGQSRKEFGGSEFIPPGKKPSGHRQIPSRATRPISDRGRWRGLCLAPGRRSTTSHPGASDACWRRGPRAPGPRARPLLCRMTRAERQVPGAGQLGKAPRPWLGRTGSRRHKATSAGRGVAPRARRRLRGPWFPRVVHSSTPMEKTVSSLAAHHQTIPGPDRAAARLDEIATKPAQATVDRTD